MCLLCDSAVVMCSHAIRRRQSENENIQNAYATLFASRRFHSISPRKARKMEARCMIFLTDCRSENAVILLIITTAPDFTTCCAFFFSYLFFDTCNILYQLESARCDATLPSDMGLSIVDLAWADSEICHTHTPNRRWHMKNALEAFVSHIDFHCTSGVLKMFHVTLNKIEYKQCATVDGMQLASNYFVVGINENENKPHCITTTLLLCCH